MGERDYRVLGPRSKAATGGKFLHLVREDAESSLCGIPRTVLDAPHFDAFMCVECIEWLLKRRMVSSQFKPVARP